MLSGIVYFDEILAQIATETGIKNIDNWADKISSIVLDAEVDIAPSGCIVRKQRTYTNGDGFYDGQYIMLPSDFTGEYSYSKINSCDFLHDRLKLKASDDPAPDQIVLKYMGFLLDSSGRPFTTRNHKEAVIARAVWKLYSPKVWMGKGDKQQLGTYKRDYNNAVLAARGNDAFPSEEGFDSIGATLRMTQAELLATNCGNYIDMDDNLTFMEGGTPDAGGSGGDCGTLTVDMIQVFESNLTT